MQMRKEGKSETEHGTDGLVSSVPGRLDYSSTLTSTGQPASEHCFHSTL
jgi:hypothetical protein